MAGVGVASTSVGHRLCLLHPHKTSIRHRLLISEEEDRGFSELTEIVDPLLRFSFRVGTTKTPSQIRRSGIRHTL
jgi:hypothetical protein